MYFGNERSIKCPQLQQLHCSIFWGPQCMHTLEEAAWEERVLKCTREGILTGLSMGTGNAELPHQRFLAQHMLCKHLWNCFRAFGSQKGHDEQMVLANMFYLLGSSYISTRDAARFVCTISVVDGCLQKEPLGSTRSKPEAKSVTAVGLIFVISQESSAPRVFLWPLGLLKAALRLLSISQFLVSSFQQGSFSVIPPQLHI